MANYDKNGNRVLFNGAALIIDVSVAADTAVRVSYRTSIANDSGKLVRDKLHVDGALPLQLRISKMVIHVLNQLCDAHYSGTALILVQEAAFLKMLQLVGLRGKKTAGSELMTSWMWDTDYYNEYRDTFKNLASVYRRVLNSGIRIVFRNSRELYRYRLSGNIDGLQSGDTITLKASLNEELGICVEDRVSVTGTFTVQVENINGDTRAFVWRHEPRLREDGTGISDYDEELRVLRMIHDEARKQLPRVTVAPNTVINSLSF